MSANATRGYWWLLVAILRPSCARSLLGEVPDTTRTRGSETTVGPSEKNAFIITIVGSVLR